jgi:hypothetical protein
MNDELGLDFYENPADHPGAQPFLKGLAENPDPLSRMMFADWLSEHGYDNAAQGQRWAAKHARRPNNPKIEPANRFLPPGEWVSVPGSVANTLPWKKDSPYRLPSVFSRAISARSLPLGHPDASTERGERMLLSIFHGTTFDPKTGEPTAHNGNPG